MNELQWTWLSLVAVLPFIFGGLLSGCRPDYLSDSPRLLAQICILRLHSICRVRVLRLTSSAVSSRGSAVILPAPDGGPASGVASGPLDIFPFGWMIESLIFYASSWNVFQLTCWPHQLFSLISVSSCTLQFWISSRLLRRARLCSTRTFSSPHCVMLCGLP